VVCQGKRQNGRFGALTGGYGTAGLSTSKETMDTVPVNNATRSMDVITMKTASTVSHGWGMDALLSAFASDAQFKRRGGLKSPRVMIDMVSQTVAVYYGMRTSFLMDGPLARRRSPELTRRGRSPSCVWERLTCCSYAVIR
jgi:hypothetical protein